MSYVKEVTVTTRLFETPFGACFSTAQAAYEHHASWLVCLGDHKRGRRPYLDRRVPRLARLLRLWDRAKE